MTDVIVVGAGVVGLMCAVRLQASGARVTLLEAESEAGVFDGPGASAAAAGMLAPLADPQAPHARLALESYRLWRRWSGEAEWRDGVRFDGGVVVRKDAQEALDFSRAAQALQTRTVLLSAGEFRRATGLRSKVEFAVLAEEEGVADPHRVLSGLMMQARALGVRCVFGADVATAEAGGVATHDGLRLEADAVVLAPGVWASRRLVEAAPALGRVRPAKGHMCQVRMEAALGPNLRAPGFYLARRREDAVLGSTMEFDRCDRRIDAEKVAGLVRAAEALLPGELAPGERAWAGVRPMSPDGWPIVGPSSGVLVAAGHSREGWLMAPITAEIVSAYVFGAQLPDAWAALSPARFENP